MVAGLLAVAAVALTLQQTDTVTFSDAVTAELYALARVRHLRQDSLVRDYRAEVRTRVDITAGRSRYARQTALFAHESVARVTWRSPNDLKVEALAARSAAPILRMVAGLSKGVDREVDEELRGDFRQEVIFDRPWFIPRALGDSIRLMGVPDRAALHPLGPDATHYYSFAIIDSVAISVPGRRVRAIRMRVRPKRLGPSLVAGDIWIDGDTGDVVRMLVVFLGEYLWDEPAGPTPEDSSDARKDNERANRFLSVEADIEYALIENRYWLPHRQLLLITAEIPWFLNATLPARAVSTFSGYEVNTSPAVEFVVPVERAGEKVGGGRTFARVDGAAVDERQTSDERYRDGYFRAGVWSDGRWEIDVPPAESLMAYPWETDFKVALERDEEKRFRESLASLADISAELPSQWTGERAYGLAWERFSDMLRFNRVQGLSLGLGYQIRPGWEYTTLHLTGRFGLGDRRPTGSIVWRRDSPAGRLDLSGYRVVREADPWSAGLGFGNTMNAVFAGHDDGDYYLALGGGLAYAWYSGILRNTEIELRFESHRSMATEVDAPVADLFGEGAFQPNPPVTEGEFARGTLQRVQSLGLAEIRQGVDVLAGDGALSGRAWTAAALPFRIVGRTGTLSLRAGIARGDSVPQLWFRVGGPHTVRGYAYGTRVGQEFWSAQLDVGLTRSAVWAPVVFADIGDTFASDPLIGAGAGLSFLHGLMRFTVSKGLHPETDVRFDLLFRAPR